jgi:hypothetical protein
MRIIFLSIFILLFFSCKTTSKRNNDLTLNDKLIIEKVIKSKKIKKYNYSQIGLLNSNLLKLLEENNSFENGQYPEFGDLRNTLEDSILNVVFNETKVNKLKYQLNKPLNVNRGTDKSNINSISIEAIVYNFSLPIYCEKENYAIIMYPYGNKIYELGGSGVILLKKTIDDWIIIDEFWNTMT